MGIFGWSLPPGCSTLPDEEDHGCEVCGRGADDCACPVCPTCETAGDPKCYLPAPAGHGLERTPEQWKGYLAMTEGEDLGFETDPYGELEFAIGSPDDFVCFDHDDNQQARLIRLHAVLNSETGSFIQNFEEPLVCSFDEAPAEAHRIAGEALTWAGENQVKLDHKGWNQDPYYWVRTIVWICGGRKGKAPARRVRGWYKAKGIPEEARPLWARR